MVGPGLGREQHMQAFARVAIQLARDAGLYLVLDADALLLIQHEPDLIRGYRKAVVTPNVAEFARMCQALVRFYDLMFHILILFPESSASWFAHVQDTSRDRPVKCPWRSDGSPEGRNGYCIILTLYNDYR